MADTNKKNKFLDYAGLSLFWSNVKKVIEDNELVTVTALTDLDTRVNTVEDFLSNQIISISYTDLKTLRDNAQLVPGQQYRITDYRCTTVQENTMAVDHVFDIIVTADSESKLNEEARAIQHDGDTYFAECDLNAWQIWYCLDNDTNRFAWADNTNGKGVIYRMIDEFNNDVPYDFKNIQFYRQWDSSTSLWSTVSSDNTGVPCYTFSSEGNSDTTSFTDTSLNKSNAVYSNVIKGYTNQENGNLYLNDNCFFGINCYSNTFGSGCYSNTFGSGCYSNTFGSGCYSNTFGSGCYSNKFGNRCYFNTFGSGCYSNTFGSDCYSNKFGNRCYFNTFDSACYSNKFGFSCQNNKFGSDCSTNTFGPNCNCNTFGPNCDYNTFGNYCYGNTFVNYCQNNTFGSDCYTNTFGSNYRYNTFGNYCYSNTFWNYCYSNTFGNNCDYNSFGNNCHDIKFAPNKEATTKYNYYQNNHFGDGCEYIVFKGVETASSSAQVQNYNFSQGLQGTSSAYLDINGVRNLSYEVKVAKNSNGELKIYCEADLIK